MIRYTDSVDNITADELEGFFVGWPNRPSTNTHLQLLRQSYKIVLAIDDESSAVVGFINAISDGVLSAYIPLLEVLPAWQGHGIGAELTRRLLAELDWLYMVDLICDTDLVGFYERFKMQKGTGMIIRNFDHQAGKAK